MNFKQKARKMANIFFWQPVLLGAYLAIKHHSLLEKEKIGCNIYVALFSV